jgi:ABC-2 type transport system permease protein
MSAPSPRRRRVLAQIAAEVEMTLARGETVLVTLGIPVLLLVFFSLVPVLPTGNRHPVDFLAPGILCLAVLSSAMVSLGISTGFERSYGVLKRLGTTPLRRAELLGAKIAGVLAVEVVQLVVLGGTALALGWRPHPNAGWALLGVVLATIAFAGLGLWMAGTLRAEVTLALANGVYIVLLLLGGILFPLSKLGGLAPLARLLPAAALSGVLHPTLGTGTNAPLEAWIVLVAWAVLAPSIAAIRFRFD